MFFSLMPVVIVFFDRIVGGYVFSVVPVAVK